MNLANLGGILVAVVVLLSAVLYGNPNPGKLVDPHGLIIVVAGTIACAGVSYGLKRAAGLIKIFFQGMFKTSVFTPAQIIEELMKLADAYRQNAPGLQAMIDSQPDLFMKEAMTMLTDKVLDEKKMVRVLHSRVQTIFERYNDDAKMFQAIGKFPPAMGLMGAVLGMILLLGSLGKPGAEKTIGPAMSVALIATFYGVCFANLFVIPIGENLGEVAKKMRTKNVIIVEGVKLISQKVNPIVLAEELNSYLLPSERLDWKKKQS